MAKCNPLTPLSFKEYSQIVHDLMLLYCAASDVDIVLIDVRTISE